MTYLNQRANLKTCLIINGDNLCVMGSVVANHENDTCYGTRLVMGSADCIYYAGLVKTPEKLFKRKLGPLPDTLQAGACVFPPFQI